MGSLPARKPISQLWEWTIRKLIGDGEGGGGGEENKKKIVQGKQTCHIDVKK